MQSDPRVGFFQRWLAFTCLIAWASLGTQVLVLAGSRGLVPFGEVLARAEQTTLPGLGDWPTLFRFGVSDASLVAGCWLGGALALLALFGVWPRVSFAVQTALYLSYTVACTLFLSFQWDNLLLECCCLGALCSARAPRAGPSRARPTEAWRGAWKIVSGGSPQVFAFRVLLFKLYFESGIAKAQSRLGDWFDGSAMSYYYETAPLPSPLAWYGHASPRALAELQSWGTLAFEIAGALLVFSPRPTRLGLFAVLTGFQLLNIATANYGFFAVLSLGLHVFLLDPSDFTRWSWALRPLKRRLRPFTAPRRRFVARVSQWAGWGWLRERRSAWRRTAERHTAEPRAAEPHTAERHTAEPRAAEPHTAEPRAAEAGTAEAGTAEAGTAEAGTGWRRVAERVGRFWTPALCAVYLAVSSASFVRQFAAPGAALPVLSDLERALAPLRVVNTYHLFSQITRERVEPEFQTFDGTSWTAHPLQYKPGPTDRAPPFVTPHQPRVDFQLWFYGLRHQRPPPRYVLKLLERMCDDPDVVQPLFATELPARPIATRVAFFRYHFASAEERAGGQWWSRESTGRPRERRCAR